MKQYTITKVNGNEVICREVNPLGKEPTVYFTDPDIAFISKLNHKAWQEAENNLKEYPIAEESIFDLFLEFNDQSLNDSHPRTTIVGQVINGEIISENGTDKVKVI